MAVSVSDPNPQCPYALKLSSPHSQSSPAQDEDRSAPPGGTDRIFTLWGSQPSIFRETDIQKRRKITGKQSYIDGCNSRHKSICPPWAESHPGYGLPKAKYILSCGEVFPPPKPTEHPNLYCSATSFYRGETFLPTHSVRGTCNAQNW